MRQNIIIIFTLTITFFINITNNLQFCSVYCKQDNCLGPNSNNCTACDYPLNFNSPTSQCLIQTSPRVILIGDNTNITIKSNNTSPTNYTCGTYTFIGQFDKNTKVNLTYSSPITQNHFRIILYSWIFLYDQWDNMDYFNVTLLSTGVRQNISAFTRSPSRPLCSMSQQQQNYMKLNLNYSHTLTSGSIIFDIEPYHSGNRKWGIKDPIIFAQICDPACDQCTAATNNDCIGCAPTYYQSGTSCKATCETGYGIPSSGSICIQCDVSCATCQFSSTNCLTCNTSYLRVLNTSSCVSTCPIGYFAKGDQCIDCSTYCINASLLKIYFPQINGSSQNQILYIDTTFSDTMDFSFFPINDFLVFSSNSSTVNIYNASNFQIASSAINSTSYRIQIKYLENIGLDILFSCEVNSIYQSSKNLYNGLGYKLDDSTYLINGNIPWFIETPPTPTPAPTPTPTPTNQTVTQTSEISLKTVNQWISNISTIQFIQQIKKIGVFSYVFPGSQLTSLIILSNNTIGSNLYEGARFWGLFVYFDVPNWQEQSNKTLYVITKPSQEIMNTSRLLIQQTQIWFRFRRTRFTTFFLLDTYMIIILLIINWVILIIFYCLAKKCNKKLFNRHLNKVYTLFHKSHQISLFYIMLSGILQFMYFELTSFQRCISLVVNSLILSYFLIYQIYIYSQLVEYPLAKIQTPRYDKFIQKYSYFLRNIQFEEYELDENWTPLHLLRPYNFELITNFKWVLMLISLPLFYQFEYGQLGTLIVLQTLQTMRVIAIRPYYNVLRNISRIIFQLLILLFFLVTLFNTMQYNKIFTNSSKSQTGFFDFCEWAGFILIFVINLGLILSFIIDLIYGCIKSDRYRMDQARRRYYFQKIQQIESYSDKKQEALIDEKVIDEDYCQQLRKQPNNKKSIKTPLTIDTYLVNTTYCMSLRQQLMRQFTISQQKNIKKWIKLGNLDYFEYQCPQQIPIKYQQYRIYKTQSRQGFQIKMYKATQIYMDPSPNCLKRNNLIVAKSINKTVNISYRIQQNQKVIVYDKNVQPSISQFLNSLVHKIYDLYSKQNTKYVYYQLFLRVNQKIYEPGEDIQIRLDKLFQVIKQQSWSGKGTKQISQRIYSPFPIPSQILEIL